MAQDFADYPEAVRNTLAIAERCTVTMELGRILLPTYPTPDNRDAFDYLVELCEKRPAKTIRTKHTGTAGPPQVRAEDDQGDGVRDYFLIVWDFIRFAKTNGIGVGGQAARSRLARRVLPRDHRHRPDQVRASL